MIDFNPHISNIDAISGALITLSLGILILNSQCEDGAREGIDIWYMGIILKINLNRTSDREGISIAPYELNRSIYE